MGSHVPVFEAYRYLIRATSPCVETRHLQRVRVHTSRIFIQTTSFPIGNSRLITVVITSNTWCATSIFGRSRTLHLNESLVAYVLCVSNYFHIRNRLLNPFMYNLKSNIDKIQLLRSSDQAEHNLCVYLSMTKVFAPTSFRKL